MSIQVKLIESPNGIADCPGFKTSGVACDIRGKGDLELLDLALVASEEPCHAAGVFTLNDVCAAPVLICSARHSSIALPFFLSSNFFRNFK